MKQHKYLKPQAEKRQSLPLALGMLLAMVVSLLLAGRMLLGLQSGESSAAASADVGILDKFDARITNLSSDALEGIMAVQKIYRLSDDIQAAPKPDPACYGSAADPAQMEEVLTAAETVLRGQTTYLSTETRLLENSEIRYYLDDSIFAATWKEVHDGCVYTYAEVKIVHPSQFRRYLAGGEYGSAKQCTTTEMSADVNAVVATSGDFYRFRNFGGIVYEGVPRRLVSRGSQTCFIDDQGDLIFSHAGEIETMEALQAFVEEHNINFSLAFGPILIEDGELVVPGQYEIGEITDRYARAALCQMDKLHYLVVTANAEGDYRQYVAVKPFAQELMNTGCKMAYTLDGGQTATIAMDNQVINRVSYGTQRKISDIIYFATAVPNGG